MERDVGSGFKLSAARRKGLSQKSPACLFETLESRRMLAGDVLTWHGDNARDGLNDHEIILTPANVNQATFGKIFSLPVDGQLYAQPLYVSNLAMPGIGVHNVVFAA